MNNNIYLKTAQKAAYACSVIFKKNFGKALALKTKSPDTDLMNFVTAVDLKIEKYLRKALHTAFPSHKFVGEEYGQEQIAKNDYYWVLDPIDGTNNFIRGVPLCCISIALWKNSRPVAAVVFDPINNQIYEAAAGIGAFLNGKRISTNQTSNPKKAYGGMGWSQDKTRPSRVLEYAMHNLGKVRFLGSTTLQMCFVASGIFDFYIGSDTKFWDFAAAQLIVTEAKGKVTDFQNKTPNINTKDLIVSTKKLHPQILKTLPVFKKV